MKIGRYLSLKFFRYSFNLYYFFCQYLPFPSSVWRKVLTHELNINTKDLRGWTLLVEGSAQAQKINVLRNLTSFVERFTFVDIGANYGEFLNVIDESNVSKLESCLLIEANPFVFSFLIRTIEALPFEEKVKNKIRASNRALVEDKNVLETCIFLTNQKYSGGGSLLKTHSRANDLEIRVQPVTVTEALSGLADPPQTDFIIKIDIEGYELNVLPDITNYLKRTAANFAILFEIHLDRHDLASVEKLKELTKTNHVYEIFPNISGNFDVDNLPNGQYDLLLLSPDLYEKSHAMFTKGGAK
jgi:FkbM family methyltransferase